MLCTLESVRIIERTNTDRPPLLSCTWLGKTGEETTKKTSKTKHGLRLNRKAATARTTTLTKGIFPTDYDDFHNWLKQLVPNKWLDEERNEITEAEDYLSEHENYVANGDDSGEYLLTAHDMEDGKPIVAGLAYIQVPVNELDKRYQFVNYINQAGNTVKLTSITAIGYTVLNDDGDEILDDNGKPVWDNEVQESPFDMAKRNLENGLASGTYFTDDETEEESETEPAETPKTEPKQPEPEPEPEQKPTRRKR